MIYKSSKKSPNIAKKVEEYLSSWIQIQKYEDCIDTEPLGSKMIQTSGKAKTFSKTFSKSFNPLQGVV